MLQRRTPPPTARRGATLVEAAFVLCLALLFLFAIMEYARYLMVLDVANNAAREGARYAVVSTGNGTTSSQVVSVVTSKMAGVDSQIQGYTVSVFAVDPTGIYTTSSNTYNYPPTLQKLSGSNWNDAQFGGGIAVQIKGTYQPIFTAIPFMTKFNIPILSSTPVTATAVMGSEAN
jgi:Flp pilus assembly protein TadG